MVVTDVWTACFVDSKYSMTPEEVARLTSAYQEIGLDVNLQDLHTEDEIVAACGHTDVLLCNGNPPISQKSPQIAAGCKSCTALWHGVNSRGPGSRSEYGVVVLNQPGISVQELSVHTTGLILDLLRNITYYDRGIRQGEWRKAKGIPCPPLQDEVLGLYGFGATSRLLYRIFHDGFGVKKIIACDPYLKKEDLPAYDVELVSFDELLRQSDILSIHVHLNKETYHSFDYEAFRKMKTSAVIINIARGGVICEPDLIRALQEGLIRGAGLDVYETEPLPADSPLIRMDNVVLSCHSAFLGVNSRRLLHRQLIEQMRQIIQENSISRIPVANKGVISKIPAFQII